MSKIVTAEKGDCFINICQEAGFLWKDVWNHPENQQLREKRKNLNILKEGDRIYIPDLRFKEYSRQSEKEYTFVLKTRLVNFTLTLLNLGVPRAEEDYILKIDDFGERKGRTDKSGTLTEKIPAKARRGQLLLGKNREEYQINFGYLDPVEEISGVQTRLQNLGFYEGEIDDKLNEETVIAIAEFQRSEDLDGHGELNEETKQKLVEVHGS